MTKLRGFSRDAGRRIRSRRWAAPLLVILALLADYASPAVTWTAVLPLLFMAVLLIFRERAAALVVLLLSSWILVPVAAGAVWALEAARGAPRLYVVEWYVPGLNPGDYARCYSHGRQLSAFVLDQPGPLALLGVPAARSFASMHNALMVWSTMPKVPTDCDPTGIHEWAILSQGEAEALRRPCSRGFPSGLARQWSPTVEDVGRAERRLPAGMAAGLARLDWPHGLPDHYRRQYAGFLREGRRVLYLNAIAHEPAPEPWIRDIEDWTQHAVGMCDGGNHAFGAVFDLDKDDFDFFEFNGTIGGPLPLKAD